MKTRSRTVPGVVQRVSVEGTAFLIDAEDAPIVDQFRWRIEMASKSRVRMLITSYGSTKILLQELVMGEPPRPGVQRCFLDRDPLHAFKANMAWLPASVIHHRKYGNGPREGSSTYRGVSWDTENRTWRASIWVKGRPRKLGSFATERKAAEAYDLEARRAFGDYALPNFPSKRDPVPPGLAFPPFEGPLVAEDGAVLQVDEDCLPLLSRFRILPTPEGYVAKIGSDLVPLADLILGPPPRKTWRAIPLDGDPRNLRRANLQRRRFASAANQKARAAMYPDRLIGVHLQGTRYSAYIGVGGRTVFLGSHATPEEAAEAYDRKALELYGPDATLNADRMPRKG